MVITSVLIFPVPAPLMATSVATQLPVALMALPAVPTTVGAVDLVISAALTNLAVAAPPDQLARLGVIPAPVVARGVVALVEVVAVARPPRLHLLFPLHPLLLPLLRPSWSPLRLLQCREGLPPVVALRPTVFPLQAVVLRPVVVPHQVVVLPPVVVPRSVVV